MSPDLKPASIRRVCNLGRCPDRAVYGYRVAAAPGRRPREIVRVCRRCRPRLLESLRGRDLVCVEAPSR